jgi:pSer/pThr/pTyr-binding forkhead associated (FHA) protein
LEAAAGERIPDGAFVRVESGFYAGLEWPLDRPSTVVGRGRNADLVLSEATISRTHAVIGFEQARMFVQDLGSTNGTLVNGRREGRAFLSDGDELQMGKLVLRVRAARARGGSR